MSQLQRQRQRWQSEKGYSWSFFHVGPSWVKGLLVTVIVVGAGSSFYIWYCQFGNDMAPDSLAGYSFAIAGTLCTALATILYAIRRRSQKLAMGQLNAALNWHVFFAVMGIAFLLMHSFGNFHAKTGTYALYGLIALIVSGFIGRVLDRLMPWLIAREVDTILNVQGDDRTEDISRSLQSQANVAHISPGMHCLHGSPSPSSPVQMQGFAARSGQVPSNSFYKDGQPLSMPWDLSFIASDVTPGEVIREENIYNFMSSKHEIPVQSSRLIIQAKRQMAEIRKGKRAMQRELFYRYVIRYWRGFHVGLALLTIGLIIWHLIYVGELMLNAFMHHGRM
ncbi:MAG TPA: hypothetical protein DIU08_00995 [Ktedonobacter sp.]|nr:hypothetical protein [Ktedonobacter sp.]HCP73200.1 hypothetical protein [Ktedonobacter sp.]